jgi:hypothetical protein
MEIQVEIETHDRQLDFDLFQTKKLSRGMEITIEKDASIRYRGTIEQLAVDFPSIIEITIITFATQVAAQVVASWLYDKIKGRAVKLRIERTEVGIDKGQIERILTEKMEETTEEK